MMKSWINVLKKEVTLIIDVTKLLANLKPKENQLLMKIIKEIKDTLELQSNNNAIHNASVATPDNMSDLKRYGLKNAYSALKTTLKLKCISWSHIVNVSAEEPVRFASLLRSKITMLDPCDIEMNISSVTNNMIGHGKRLRKDLINLVSKIRNSSTNMNGIKKRIIRIKEIYNEFNPYNSNNVNNSITLYTMSFVAIDSHKFTCPVTLGRK